MEILDALIFGQEVPIKKKEDYVLIYVGGLEYKLPKDIYEKMVIKHENNEK